ncbi:hypothetical protein BJ138DRAFT_1147775 [Hygrophoropsis aurantiaca]|uniref:Uncharacterized protein n=1 Tax=Hygrophoropsis aurantiaca TaxID=72124 RepID=A0ACB8AGT3_9AGAM|nr:hypothetical protein BJ138DRAFT_1147775 [Hygrophoropsis aurantiaca]
MVNPSFAGDTKIEVVTVLANCGSDIARAREALVTYIQKKQEKGRSTEHILKKLNDIEITYVRDRSLHAAFRDARAMTYLPKSSLLPLPEHLRQRSLTDITTRHHEDLNLTHSQRPSMRTSIDSTPSSVYTTLPEPSPVSPDLRGVERRSHEIQGGFSKNDLMKPRPAHISVGSPIERSRRASLRSQLPPIRSSPPTTPLPATPYEYRDPPLSPDNRRAAYPTSSTIAYSQEPLQLKSFPNGVPNEKYSPHSTGHVHHTMIHQEPQTSLPTPAKGSRRSLPEIKRPIGARQPFNHAQSGPELVQMDLPPPYLDGFAPDSPAQSFHALSGPLSFGSQLDAILRTCNASRLVRKEVLKCLHCERGYEREDWEAVLDECGLIKEAIPTILLAMEREVRQRAAIV